jgi:hypothetical protein
MPKSSMATFAVVLAAIVVLLVFTHGSVTPLWLRWAVTGVWAVATVILGIRDLVLTADPQGLDSKPVDRWTFIHGSAGIVFGIWYTPLWVVLLVTVGWEVFEALVPGFGDKEIFLNRLFDVVSAVAAWFVVVLIIMVTGAPFPLLHG